MLVHERMSRHPLTIKPDTRVDAALKRMREEKVRRFPVLDDRGKLVGIVSDKDLLYAAPSPATSLSIHELHYLYSRITVDQVMTRKVITVDENDPLEEAARIMIDNKVGGLPVMRDGDLVGLITETDIFKTFMEMMGARDQGVRLTLLCPDQPGKLAGVEIQQRPVLIQNKICLVEQGEKSTEEIKDTHSPNRQADYNGI